MIKTTLRTTLVILLILFGGIFLFAQTKKSAQSQEKYWVIARVLDTEPFVLEYLDDKYSQQSTTTQNWNYSVSIEVNPQSTLENIKRFKVGDIINGEFCSPWIEQNCGIRKAAETRIENEEYGIALPPSVVINLKKLGGNAKAKYKNKGLVLHYAPKGQTIIRDLKIFRDDTIFISGLYGNEIRRRLSAKELKSIIEEYLTKRINKTPSDRQADYFGGRFLAVLSGYQSLNVENPSRNLKNFLARLDTLISNQFKNATYIIHYLWRYQIKDWQFGDIFPLDEAVADIGAFLEENRQVLSLIKPPPDFLNEAKEYSGKINLNFYRYKNQLYGFEFPICTIEITDNWTCFRAWNVRHADWSENLQIKLRDIPPNSLPKDNLSAKGLDIPKAELEQNREFYTSFLLGSNLLYKEGDYVYEGLRVKFH